ncbi:MAG: hypothetical protein SFZ02_04020, partial [bacterium]|nr:hypothetical protein [bacterium]
YQVVQKSKHRPLSSVYLESVTGLAYMLFHDGDIAKSALLAGCLKAHPNITAELKKTRLDPLIALYKTVWDDEQIAQTLIKAESADFEALVTEILDQYALYE